MSQTSLNKTECGSSVNSSVKYDLMGKIAEQTNLASHTVAQTLQQIEKCANCNCQISFDNMEADHNFAWSKGGITNLENAQSLYVSCNRAKSAS